VVIAAAEEVAPNGVRTTMDLTFEVEGSERPTCVAEVVYIYSFPEDSTVTPSP
jgi:hypothetical protein